MDPGPCPACGAALSLKRRMWHVWRAPVRPSSSFYEIFVACPGCLAIVRLTWSDHGEPIAKPAIEVSGAVAARMRERTSEAERAGTLAEELGRWIDLPEGIAIGVPEVFADVKHAIGGGFVRLAAHSAATNSISAPAGTDLRWPPWELSALRDVLTDSEIRSAKGDALGGFLMDAQGWTPRMRVLRATRFEVVGLWERRLRLAAPAWVARVWPEHPGFLADRGLALPDRVGRPR